jgi:TPR repeat protein
MFATGSNLPKDAEQAVILYRKAALSGMSNAQNNLGAMYENGEGVTKNLLEAIEWYRKSASAGNEWGRRNLQRLLESTRSD